MKSLTIEQLENAIVYLTNTIEHKDYSYYLKSGVHILAHNEILTFQNSEIENYKNGIMYKHILDTKNPFLFSALLKKNLFSGRYKKETRDLLVICKEPSHNLYDLIYAFETDTRDNLFLTTQDRKNFFFLVTLDFYVKKFDANNKEQISVIDYAAKNATTKSIMDYVTKNCMEKTNLCNHLFFNYLKHENKININHLLPSPKHSTRFFITLNSANVIKYLLEKKFRFNDNEYSFHGENLFFSFLKMDNKNIQNILMEQLLPTLNNLDSTQMTKEEQDDYISKIHEKHPEHHKLIKAQYKRMILENLLEERSDNATNKTKI